MKAELDRVNELQLWDFEASPLTDGRVTVLGSNDFDYYHHVEMEFSGVTSCDLPAMFSHAEFLLSPSIDPDEPGPKTVYVFGQSKVDLRTEFTLRAESVVVTIGTVYYYQRENLKPGERIAPWARKTPG